MTDLGHKLDFVFNEGVIEVKNTNVWIDDFG